MLEKLVTAEEIADSIGIRAAHLLTLAREGIVPCVRFGRRVRFSPSAIEKFVADGGEALAGGWRREAPESDRRSA